MALPSTALILIDMQNDVLQTIVPTGHQVVPAIKRTLEAFRRLGLPVIHCLRLHRANGVDVEKFRIETFRQHPFLVPGTLGGQVIAELTPLPGEQIVSKSRFSGFFQTDLLMMVQRLGIKRLVVVGLQTPNCVRATVTDALAYDLDVVVLDDAITALTPEIHRANMYDMEHMGAVKSTVDAFLATLEK